MRAGLLHTLACCAVMCTAHAAYAQETSRAITGRVIEAGLDDYGVVGVTVTVEGTALSTTTDEDGVFHLEVLPATALTLNFQGEDYATALVTLDAETTSPLIIELTWAGQTEEVGTVARAWREVVPSSTTRLSARDMQAAPRRSAEEVLRQVPGLTLVQHGSEGKGYQYFMRGFDAIHGADLEITLDGMPINEWSNVHAQGYLDLALIIPEMIERVEVTKGPFTLEQGAFAMAGSAHYRLGVPNDSRGTRAAYTFGTTHRHRIFMGYSPSEGTGREFVGVEATRDEGFGMQRSIERVSMNARKRVLGNEHDDLQLDLTALGSAARFELPGPLRQEDVQRGVLGFYDTYDTSSQGEAARALLSAELHTRSARQHAHTTFYVGYRHLDLLENFTGFLIDPVHGDRRQQQQDTWSYGLLNTFERNLHDRLNLKLGFGVRADHLTQRELQIGQQLEARDTRRDLNATQLISHGLMGLQWRPTEHISLDAGARADLMHINARDQLADGSSAQHTQATLSPRLSTQWQATPTWRLLAAYGRGFRPPEARAFSSFEAARMGISEDLYEGGEPATTTSQAIEIGTRWDAHSALSFTLSGFATFIARESIFDHVSGTSLELNGTRRLGAELVVDVQPLEWLTLSADATYADARFVNSGNPVPLAPWLVSGLRVVATHPRGWRGGLRALYVAPRTLPHNARGATLTRFDATLGYQWRALQFGIEIENLLNQQLREGEYHYASHWRQDSPASQVPVLHTTAGPPLNARLTLGAQF